VAHSKATVHGNNCTCDVRRSRAGKKSYNACYFVYRCGAPKGNGSGKIGKPFRTECGSHVGIDWAGSNNVYCDVA
jgi:hypothetical protein